VSQTTDAPAKGAVGRVTGRPARSDRERKKGGSSFGERYAVLVILLIVVVFFSFTQPDTFATADNAKTILQQQAVLACLALGLLFPIAIGEFDLSVGYILGFTAIEAAALGGKTDLPGGLIIAIVLLTGPLIGALSGALVARFGVNSLIATLGVGFGVSGLTVGVSGSQTLFEGVPSAIPKIANTQILGIQSTVWIVLVLAIVTYVVLSFTPFGRKIYAIGGSERVARLAGIRTSWMKLSAFAIAGLFAGFAGLLQLGQTGAANPSFGLNLLLPAFAAIFLGATAIRPGHFNVWGTIVAILLLAAGFTGLGLMGVPSWIEPIFDGVVLLVAVLFARSDARNLGASG
jgi:ribose transport system permease protein